MPSALPMDRKRPSVAVRTAAGRILVLLERGSFTVWEIEQELRIENRTIKRALDHIKGWDVGLKVDRSSRKGVKGMRPFVYSLDEGGPIRWLAIRVKETGHASAVVALALSLEAQ